MILSTFRFIKSSGWSIQPFPAMDSANTLILVFAAPEFIDDPDPIKQLSFHYPHSIIIGCSTAGEIYDEQIEDHTISVAIMQFEKTEMTLSVKKLDDANISYDVGKTILQDLIHERLRGIFVLSDGLHVNGSELVKGLRPSDRDDIVITGGLAGDSSRFKQTWIIVNGDIFVDKVAAVGFYGDHIRIGHGSKGGWDIFGPARRITRSKYNILYELDGKSALALYKEYLGDKASGLPATGLLFPLAIRKNIDDPKQLVRTILGVDEEAGSLIFAGDMPIGYLAQLMRANFDRLITGAKQAGELAISSYKNPVSGDHPSLLIAISCVGRRLLLGERTEEEIMSVLNIFPRETKLVGFYSYGEISPYVKGECELHNQTMTLTLFSEEI